MSEKINRDLYLPVIIPWMNEKKVGRPTKYHPIFCYDLIDHMSNGGSLKAFTGYLYRTHKVKINPDTIFEWLKVHDEFSESYELGKTCALDFFEQLSVKVLTGKLRVSRKVKSRGKTKKYYADVEWKHVHFRIWAVHMMNRFDWKFRENAPVVERKSSIVDDEKAGVVGDDKSITVNLIIPDNGRRNG